MRSNIPAWRAAGCALLLALSLAGCGIYDSAGSGPSAAEPTPGSAALNGCPTQQAPVSWPPAAVVLTATGAQGATATAVPIDVLKVTLTRGQIVDVRLSATIQWRIARAPSAAVLLAARPAGWYDAQHRACVWRFTAAGVGETRLDLSGGLVCAPHTACPALAAIAQYAVTVR